MGLYFIIWFFRIINRFSSIYYITPLSATKKEGVPSLFLGYDWRDPQNEKTPPATADGVFWKNKITY
ncbi:hypothetical protein CHM34_03580 [Paludifilum halophilum]|uniref:Uncharacterized protein n=1 Tax=Paludifilum halophilum TaxID=1642702 RepID=A0A235BAG4_9BACL|nr:hypothetical protein CHM34_03580 [Paludifilum halophilum]